MSSNDWILNRACVALAIVTATLLSACGSDDGESCPAPAGKYLVQWTPTIRCTGANLPREVTLGAQEPCATVTQQGCDTKIVGRCFDGRASFNGVLVPQPDGTLTGNLSFQDSPPVPSPSCMGEADAVFTPRKGDEECVTLVDDPGCPQTSRVP